MTMAQVCGFVICLFIGLLGLTILYLIWKGQIDLTNLLDEVNGQASMSRFQLLIFTFVIAISLFEIVESGMKFPEIPNGILTLLGISASTYAVGKGISYSQPQLMGASGNDDDEEEGDTADAKTHADNAKGHADSARQSAQQAADSAAQAKVAADKATGTTS